MIDSPKPARTVAYGPLVWGAILIVIGVGWLLGALDIADVPWRALIAAVLVIVGVVMIAASTREDPPRGLFGAGVALSVVLALMSTFSTAFAIPLSGGVGDRTYQPTIDTLDTGYHLVAGELLLHLDDVAFPAGGTHIDVGVTFGRVLIDGIDPDVAVFVDGRAGAGELILLDSRQDGITVEQQVADVGFDDAPSRLVIDVRVGFGKIEVYR